MAVFLAASLVLQPVGIQAADISVDTEEESTETADFSDDAEIESDEAEQGTVSVEDQENTDSDTEVTVEEENQEADETVQEEVPDFTSEETDAFSAGDEEDYIVARGDCSATGSRVTWTIDQNQVLRIQGSGEMMVTISTREHWKDVKTVEIGDGVTNIYASAFYRCSNIEKIIIPESVTSIEHYAFSECSSLKDIALPARITSIEEGTFSGCNSLEYITIPEKVTQIGIYAFEDCSSIEKIVIPKSVTSIEYYAFCNCSRLKDIVLPEGITSIEKSAFSGCSSLESITIPESVTSIGESAFYHCDSLSDIIIPGNMVSIGESAFKSCGLKEVRLHKGVESIGTGAFSFNENLKYFFYEGTEAELNRLMEDKPSAKYHYETLDHVYENIGEISSTCQENGNTIAEKCKFCGLIKYVGDELPLAEHKFNRESCSFDDATKTFVAKCAYGCGTTNTYKTEFETPDLLFGGRVDDSKIWYVDSDYTLYIEGKGELFDSLELYIGNPEDNNTLNLNRYPIKKIVLGKDIGGVLLTGFICKFEILEVPDRADGVTLEIGEGTFENTNVIRQVDLGKGVTGIGARAFSGCRNLCSVKIRGNVERIRDTAFYNCDNLTEVILPDSVVNIEAEAFYSCGSLSEIVIPDSVTNIGGSAFRSCTKLKNVILSKNISNIGGYAFSYCRSLENITIPGSVTSIGENAFCDCSSLKNITLSNGTTSIGSEAFDDCESLESITIPDSVTEYGYGVFNGCTSLKKAILSKNAETIASNMFRDCENLEEVIIPEGVKDIQSRAFENTDKCNALIPMSVTSMASYPGGKLTLPCRWAFQHSDFTIDDKHTYYHENGPEDFDEDNCSVCIRTGECGSDATYKLTFHGKLTISGRGTAYYSDYTGGITSLTVENGIYYLNNSFYSQKLETVKIADSVKEIGSFNGCSGLKTVTLGKNVEGDLSQCFEGDTSLETVTISEENPNYTVKDGIVYSKDMSTLVLYPQNKQGEVYEIPSSVKTINEEALTYNQNLKKIILPENLEITYQENRNLSFANSKNLETVVFCKNLTFIPSELMSNCPALTELTIPDGVEEIWDNSLNGAFANCKNLRKVTLPASLKRIGHGAFDNCLQLTEVHYLGTEEQWKQMEIGSHNEYLTDAVLHSYECVEEVLPDCENAGKRVYKCSTCDDSFTVVLPAKGHQIVEIPAIAATCETAGMTAGSKCSVCGKTITEPQQGEAALGHDFGEWQVTAETTCETSGKKTRKCSRCEATETEELPALEHVPSDWETIKDATCEKNGEEVQECTRCGKVLDKKELPALGHVLSEWYIIKDVTCGENGEQVQICNRCGEVLKKEPIPATGKHEFGSWRTVKATTVLAEGQRERSCSVCGKKDRASIAKLKKVLTLNVSGTIPVKVKQTFKVSVTMGKGDSVKTWKSSNTKIATVKNGTVQGVKAGTATITVTLKSGISKNFKVKVQKTDVATTSIKVVDAITKKTVGKSVLLKANGRLKLAATVSPMTSKQKVTYTTSNKKIVTVDSKGNVKAIKKGSAVITVKSGKKIYKITVKVK